MLGHLPTFPIYRILLDILGLVWSVSRERFSFSEDEDVRRVGTILAKEHT
jgi:hypothetical protein